eukprot:XP_011678324.1 PREDICTED: glycogenin-1 isoform X3 [Strongylocentrotus purpuratus]
MSGKVEDQAFVTLVTNDRYAYGALVVGQSLRDVGTTRQLAILITPQVTQPMRRQLSMLYDYIQEVNPLDSQDDAHLALLTRPDLGITFTKLYSWRLTQYSKCVFLDADTLVLQNVDDLFDREELSAAPDVGWPDCFNSGVFVFKPSNETYRGLLQCADSQGSFDGGDQGLLNTFFSDWATADINKHLPFIYNMTSAISYSYLPAFVRFGNEVRIVHFIGRTKPWMYRYNTQTGTISRPSDVDVTHDSIYVKMWWDVFMSKVKPRIEQEQHVNFPDGKSGTDLANALGDLVLEENQGAAGQPRGPPSPRSDQHAWERGQIDYRGSDSFDNIMGRITEVMSDPAIAAAAVDSNSITPVNVDPTAAAENNATKS